MGFAREARHATAAIERRRPRPATVRIGAAAAARPAAGTLQRRLGNRGTQAFVARARSPAPPAPETCPAPPELACKRAIDSPGAVTNTLLFPVNSSGLNSRQIAEVDATAWNAARQSGRVRVDGYASAEGTCGHNWRLSCRRAESVARELEHPADGSPKVPAANIDRFAHGESSDVSATALAPNRIATISIPMPVPPRSAPAPSAPPSSAPPSAPVPAREPGIRPRCDPCQGIPPTNCGAYEQNRSWLPPAYVHNATCACQTTPNTPSANCVRAFLQQRLAATPAHVRQEAMRAKQLNPFRYVPWVIRNLTPRIERDHIDAYRAGCCPSGPAPSWAWVGVTTTPLPCFAVDRAIRYGGGSCHGRRGEW